MSGQSIVEQLQEARRTHLLNPADPECSPTIIDNPLAASLADHIEAQAAEIERLQQHVHDCQAGMYINCVYCGHRYGPDDEVPATMADVLKEHIEQCPKHPMSALKAELTCLREVVERTADGRIPKRLVWHPGIAKSHCGHVQGPWVQVYLDVGHIEAAISSCYSTEKLAEAAREAAQAAATKETPHE